MKKYTLYWRTGQAQVIEARKGLEPHEAFTMAGYSAGAARALDFWSNGDTTADWVWNPATRSWDNVLPKT